METWEEANGETKDQRGAWLLKVTQVTDRPGSRPQVCWLLARCSWCCDLPDVGKGVALGEVVGVTFPEDVAHSAAGHNFQAPSAHPHPEGELCRG